MPTPINDTHQRYSGNLADRQALETPGMVTEIITAAEEAVKTKVLAHYISE